MFQLFAAGLVVASLASTGLGHRDYRTREIASSKLCDMSFFELCGVSVLSIQSRDDEVVSRCVAELKRRKNKDRKRLALLLLDLPAGQAVMLASQYEHDAWEMAGHVAFLARSRGLTYLGDCVWATGFERLAVSIYDPWADPWAVWLSDWDYPQPTLYGVVWDLRYNE